MKNLEKNVNKRNMKLNLKKLEEEYVLSIAIFYRLVLAINSSRLASKWAPAFFYTPIPSTDLASL